MSSGRSDQLQPQDQCPAREGPTSNFNRQTGVRGVKDQRQTSTAGLGQGRRTNVNSVDSARAACEGPTSNSASTAFPRGRLYGLPVQQGSRTQVSMVGNRGKSLTTHPLLPRPTPPREGFRHPSRRLPPKCSQKFTTNPAHSGPSTAATGRGSGHALPTAEAPAASALSACRRALSCAS